MGAACLCCDGPSVEMNMTRAEYLLFQELVESSSGLRFEDRDWTPLRSAVCQRMVALGVSSPAEYYELLTSRNGGEELVRLTELLTVQETAFFRNPAHFELLTRMVLPELLERRSGDRVLRLWSAGCSTGQEAYSIAISLLETLPDVDEWSIDILATDISPRALAQGKSGVYPARAFRSVDPSILDRYFEPCEGGFRVVERARRLVRFEQLNLVKEPFPLAALRPLDVIFCENVTIYFKPESTRRVIRNFHDALADGGFLFLGYSETLWRISSDFLLRSGYGSFVYQKPPTTRAVGLEVRQGGAGRSVHTRGHEREIGKGRRHGRRFSRRAAEDSGAKRESLERATSLYEAKRFEEALLAVEALLAAEPGDVGAHLLAAKLRADREDLGPAMRHCMVVLQSDPLLVEAHYLMALLRLRSGDVHGAAESFGRVVYLDPSGQRAALAHFHLAGIHVDNGELHSAAREYRNAIRLLEKLPKDELVEEFSADFLVRVCRRRLEELVRQ